MATYTPNFGLHQWVPEDNFLRTDFNQDFSKIDAAIQQVKTDAAAANTATNTLAESKCRMVTGTYTGNGSSTSGPRDINLGFHPQAVLVETSSGSRPVTENGAYSGLALRGASVARGIYTSITVTSTGFQVDNYANSTGQRYYYIAFA